MKRLKENPMLLGAVIAAVALVSSLWLLENPRSTLPFLLTLGSLLAALLQPIPKWLKVIVGGAILLLVIPAAGFKTSFLFELGI